MPEHAVKIVEVGPRDGLQNIKEMVPTRTKIELIERLASTGLQTIETTSFVAPKWVPQLADAKDVMQSIRPLVHAKRDISFPVLVPNVKGFEAALEGGAKEVSIFLSASEGFSRKNIACSMAESLQRAQMIAQEARKHNIRIRGYLSCVVECPYDGRTPPAAVLGMAKQMLDIGCYEISLGDTTGAATPGDVRRLLDILLSEISAARLAGHFHDTFGQAVANVVEAYQMGIRVFDSSVAGLGGCPYSPGAKGNVATEDMVYLFENMGIATGVDLDKLSVIGDWVSRQLGISNSSRAGAALISRRSMRQTTVSERPAGFDEWRLLQDLSELLVHRRGSTIKITMHRPKNGNALTADMIIGLIKLMRGIASDSSCFTIVLTAEGKFFCTGMDLKNVKPESRKQNFERLRELFDTIEEAPQTTVAFVNGPAYGGGVGLAFACDIRLVAEKATFQLTEVRLGICPAVISKFVFREWGIAFAREAMLSARSVSAKELATKTGAIHVVANSQEPAIAPTLDQYIQDLSSCAPEARGQVKHLARAAWKDQGRVEQTVSIEKAFDDMMSSEEQQIGAMAFSKGVRKVDWESVLSKPRSAKL
ncbi:pyruvate carboxyltransferase [Aureobasidium subglaciale]|nr:pyruvate carboxyltransferase [Aureobasidium subglaciale]